MSTKKENEQKFTFIDLFAGVGGFHQAMKSLGGKCVFASEIDSNCQKTYSNQFNIEVHGDINNFIDSIPNFDVLCGGFPCQTFSKAGKQMGFEDEVRGKLFFRIVDILKLHPECKFIILENVRNLADDINFWNVIQEKLQELDFYVTKNPLIKSPDDFGIPQNRERVYILGIKKELRDISKIQNEWIDLDDIDLSSEYKKCINKTAFSILDLENVINKDYIITNEEKQIINAWEEFKKTILPHNQIGTPIWLDFFGFDYDKNHDIQYYNDYNFHSMPQWKQKFVSRNRTFYLSEKKKIDAWYKKYENILSKKIYRKFEWNCGPEYQDFKNCILQFRQSGLRIKRSDKFPSLVAIINTPIIWDSKLKEYRRLTIREAANLQSFDPNYKFICEDHATYKQLGNSVNVKVIKIIAERLFNLAVPDWEKKIMNQVEEKEDGFYVLNIQPKASVLSVFSRLNYKPWYAIAEFVDNSTQSFYNHEAELEKQGIKAVHIQVNYNFESNILTIIDDAFGMNLEEFSRAVQMDIAPENKNGRNEFGMGLKTAASWFGNKWKVISTRYGDTSTYSTEVDIPALKANEQNTIKIVKTSCATEDHGTVIIIEDITKKIDASRTKGKIIEILESMYRRDINSRKVNITFNDTPLFFEPYTCLSFRERTWKKDVKFNFDFDGKTYHVKGFVGILSDGGFGKAGFALFRRERVIIGGVDMNYKPNEIFHQSQSPIAHKLFGELDLDDFPVNQAKDGFVWDNGLETLFISHLKENIQEYINIAKLTNKEREKEESLSQKTSINVQEAVAPFVNNISQQNRNPSLFEAAVTNPEASTEETLFKQFLETENSKPTIISDVERTYPIQINNIKKKNFIVKWAIGNNDYWINVDDSKPDEVTVIININHSFFKPYSNNEEFKIVLEKFVIAFVVAEQLAKETSDSNGYIRASSIRNKMNSYLSQIQGE